MTTSQIVTQGNSWYLLINGRQKERLAYITYFPQNGCYREFARAGYRLYSVCVFFGTNKMNEHSGFDVPGKGIFDDAVPDFSCFDREVRTILVACPDACIFPRVNVSAERQWELENPDELCYAGTSKFPERKRVCFASEKWARLVESRLSALIAHIESSDYAAHIIGYQIAGGNTEEWFAFDDRGGKGKRSDEAFEAFVKAGGDADEASYQRLLSQIVAERICRFAAHIKKETQHRLVVGTFYGYTMEKYNRGGTHHALKTVLQCPEVDFICSPASYAQTRKAGRDQPYMLPLHSLKLHGKLYFAENDIRTHLSRPVCDNPHYNTPIWFGPSPEETIEILKMHFAKSLINGHALWWFDMWGGWYADPRYMAFMEQAKMLADDTEAIGESAAEIAVLVDEAAPSFLDDKDPGLRKVFFDFRENLGKSAVPLHWYLASDFEAIKEKYQAFVLLEPIETTLSAAIKASGKPVLTVNPDNCDMTTDGVRSFCKAAGVNVYCDRDAVIYANSKYLFVHTVTEGQQRLQLPEGTTLRECFTNNVFETAFQSPAGKSYLFQIST